jgi:REP element-mobilizing transposase RayT
VSHLRRPELKARHPVHVTMRLAKELPNLRHKPLARLVLSALHAAKQRLGASLVHFSIQSNHLHLIVEAADGRALSSAMKGLAIRLARSVNRRCGRRGRVFAERFHARALRTPLEVRRALIYVLHNHRHHHTGMGQPSFVDALSSAAYFDGFAPSIDGGFVPSEPAPVAKPSTWLLRVGWRRFGLLQPHDVPK